jgi:pimeloyl-ACP methyl ester carboxylesterase
LNEEVEVRNWDEAARQCRLTYQSALPGMPAAFWREFAKKNYREGVDGRPELDSDPDIATAILKDNQSRIAGVRVDTWAAFASLDMPCLVLRGELSDLLSADIVRRMSGVKPDLKSAVIPNRGHAPLLDEPASLVAIDSFLKSLLTSGG